MREGALIQQVRPVGRQRLDVSLRPMERPLRAAKGFYWLKLPTARPCTTPGQGDRGDQRGPLQLIQHTNRRHCLTRSTSGRS